jgi:hypothetical protein
MSVISQPASATTKFKAIVEIHKYKSLHEKHHFIPWRCTAHPGVIWIISLGSVFIFSMIDNQKII